VRPVHPAILEAIRNEPDLPPLQVAYAGISTRWDWNDVAVLEEALIEDPDLFRDTPRRSTKGQKYVTRKMRVQNRRTFPYRYIRRHGVMMILDGTIGPGPVRTLELIICRCGKNKTWTTLTSWIAHDLGLHVRTIQRHLNILRGKYIAVSLPDAKTQKITIAPLAACEVQKPIVAKKAAESNFSSAGGATKMSRTHDIKSVLKRKNLPRKPPVKRTSRFDANSSSAGGAAFRGFAPPADSRGWKKPVGPAAPYLNLGAHDPNRQMEPSTEFEERMEKLLNRHGMSLYKVNPASREEEHTRPSQETLPGLELGDEPSDAQLHQLLSGTAHHHGQAPPRAR
jgi:hypothetical protein